MKFSLKALFCLNLALIMNSAAFAYEYSTYDKIQDLFEGSSVPATLNNFEDFGSKTKKKCMLFDEQGAMIAMAPFQKRIQVIKNHTPDGGPLMPPSSSEIRRDVLVPADFLDLSGGYADDLSKIIEQVSSNISIRQRISYLQVNIRAVPSSVFKQSWFATSTDPLEVHIRKNGEFLAMKLMVEHRYAHNLITVAYGYCWNK